MPAAGPAVVCVLYDTRQAGSGQTKNWFAMWMKLDWLKQLLHDRWQTYDRICVVVLIMIIQLGAMDWRLKVSQLLVWPTLICGLAFILMPTQVNGSYFADMRLLPCVFVFALLAIRVKPGYPRYATGATIAGAVFLAVQVIATTVSFARYDRVDRHELAAVASIPRGAAVLALIARPCMYAYYTDHLDHIAGLTTVRRDAFVNDQWNIEGERFKVIRPGIGNYAYNPSQIVLPAYCRRLEPQTSVFDTAITGFNRKAFDYVWTIGFPLGRAHANDLKPVWSNDRSALYRVVQPVLAKPFVGPAA